MDDADLTRWLVEQLGTIHGWLWSADDPYDFTDDVTHVFEGGIPADARRAIGARIFGGEDDDETDTKTRRVQLRSRGNEGDPNDANRVADAAFAHLRRLLREGVVSAVTRTSFDPAGVDQNGREGRTDNYLIIFDNEEAPS
ncbi:phage tail terminator protein [Microbacterium testaceum]|uniref:phage tail terminator protein n=1 Tax=Microbacterium testaceum TaxID=2033 RepID=UPI00243558E3|nr:minor capsid protein [Microbacterium testaceum]